MDVSDISARQRLGIGVAFTLFAQVLVVVGSGHIGPDLGPIVKIGGLSVLLGVGFLGAALEPVLTRRLGGSEWDALSTGKQTVALFVMALTAIVLYGIVSTLGSIVTRMVA